MRDDPRETIQPALPRRLALAVSFWGGFQIMVLEICGLRVLASNLGSSVLVTGTLLTLLMGVLAAGYYSGGVLSTRSGEGARWLITLLLGAALYSAILSGPLLEAVASLGMAWREALSGHVFLQSIAPSALLTLVLYGPPVFVMSMISPYLIRLHVGRRGDAGRADAGIEAGFFMSLSTAGSIVGTMLASYLAVPVVGVHATAIATSAAFFVLLALAWSSAGPALPPHRRWRSRGVFATLLIGLALCGFRPPSSDPSLVYRAESHYGDLEVYQESDAAGRARLTYHPSRVYMHSMLYPAEPLRDMEGNLYLIPGLLRPPERALVLGSAAGGALRALALAFPDAELTGVDLDPKVHEVATTVFGVDAAKTRLVTADARVFLAEAEQTYDLIIVDLFAGEFIPSHCATLEFFELVRRRLSSDGAVFINTNMNDIPFEAGDGGPFRAVRHLQATLRAAGLRGLVENAFFNSVFAFPDDMTIERFRAGLARQWQSARWPAPLRAAAGLALYTSFAVPDERARYRPYTDAWTPALSIELKSNATAIYAALERRGTAAVLDEMPSGAAPRAVLEQVLARHFAEWRDSKDKGFEDVTALIQGLDEVQGPLDDGALDTTARYFQFAPEPEGASSALAPRTPWAELASLYARAHALGHANEYEQVLAVLEELHSRLPVP